MQGVLGEDDFRASFIKSLQNHPPELSDHHNVQNFTPDSILRVPRANKNLKQAKHRIFGICLQIALTSKPPGPYYNPYKSDPKDQNVSF